MVSESKLFARGCHEHSAALLPYVRTANAARDMDVLRAALGDARLTYLGKSYGTYLGTWYAPLFPARVRALVLDAYWPVHAVPPVRLRGKGALPILGAGTTRDPASRVRWARALAGDLKSGVLLGWNGGGHTAYMRGSSCVDSAVDKYLVSLVVPRNGTVCP